MAELVEIRYRQQGLPPTRFTGYGHGGSWASTAARVLAIRLGVGFVASAAAGAEIEVVLDRTPYYGEKDFPLWGWSDRGALTWWDTDASHGQVQVTAAYQPYPGLTVLRGQVAADTVGPFSVGQEVTATVDEAWRSRHEAQATAALLLHAALSRTLEPHYELQGCVATATALEVLFCGAGGLGPTSWQAVEDEVNRRVRDNLLLHVTTRPWAAMGLPPLDDGHGPEGRFITISCPAEGSPYIVMPGWCPVAPATGSVGLVVLLEVAPVWERGQRPPGGSLAPLVPPPAESPPVGGAAWPVVWYRLRALCGPAALQEAQRRSRLLAVLCQEYGLPVHPASWSPVLKFVQRHYTQVARLLGADAEPLRPAETVRRVRKRGGGEKN